MMSCELIFTHLPAGPLSQQTPCDSEKQTQCKKIIKAAAWACRKKKERKEITKNATTGLTV